VTVDTVVTPASVARPPVVDVRDLKVHFPIKRSTRLATRNEVVHAVDGVSLTIQKGETLGLVGESGCGKSTLGRAVAGLYKPTSGQVLIDGVDIGSLSPNELRPLRRRFQIVFQDPYMSLNPRMTVGGLIGEGLAIHRIGRPNERPARVAELMDLVGLRREHVSRYPHEFSGGQRQRIAIARALAVDPELVVLDEPVSALDVSIQSQILRLLVDLQQRLGLTYLLIGHDLAVIGNTCQRVVVMYLGRVAETAEREPLYRSPLHPYTRALFSSAPIPDPTTERERRRIPLEGEVPSPIHPPSGCRFNTRCPIAIERCRTEEPLLRQIALDGRGPGDLVACHRAEEVAAGVFPVLAGSWAGAGTAVGAGSLPAAATSGGATQVAETPAAAAS
jgi:oligopeptide transport system ATP-binding protein